VFAGLAHDDGVRTKGLATRTRLLSHSATAGTWPLAGGLAGDPEFAADVGLRKAFVDEGLDQLPSSAASSRTIR
jgi:hypothetical protein